MGLRVGDRVLWTCVIAGLVALLGWSSWLNAAGQTGLWRIARSPVDGEEVVITLAEVQALHADGYDLGRGPLTFRVRGAPGGLAVGEEITVGGVIEHGVVVEQWRADAPGRPAKKALGLLALLAVVVGVAGSVRVENRRLALRG